MLSIGMKKREHLFALLAGMITLFIVVIQPTQAQRLCEAIVREALTAAGENCRDLDGELACYAYDSINPTFYVEDVGRDALTAPGTSIDLPVVHTVKSNAYDEDEDEWGIGYFQVAFEDILTDEEIRIIMMGDVLLENAVTTDDTTTEFEPFEKLYMEAGERSACQEAMNDMVVQTPRDVDVELTINDVPVAFGSTVVFGLGIENGQLIIYIAVLEGSVTLYPGTPNELVLEENQVTTAPAGTSDGENVIPIVDALTGEPILGTDGEPAVRQAPTDDFAEPTDITEDGEGIYGFSYYETVYNIPASLLLYPLTRPAALAEATEEVTEEPVAPVSSSSSSSGSRFSLALIDCQVDIDDGMYIETWQVSGLSSSAERIVFVGESSVGIAPASTISIRQHSPTFYAYALVNGQVIEAIESFNAICPAPTATPTPTPTATPVPSSSGGGGGGGSNNDSYGYGAAWPEDNITIHYAADQNQRRNNLLGMSALMVVGMVGLFSGLEKRRPRRED